jgi:hypothetical protein
MKLKLLALSLVALPFVAANASNTVVSNFVTVQANKPQTHPVMLSSLNGPGGNVLIANNSGIVATGYFTGTDALFDAVKAAPVGAARQTAWAAAAAAFVQFGASGPVGGPSALNNAGLYKLTAGAANPPGSQFEGKNIYTVVGNAATLAGSIDVMVFKSTNTFAVDPTPEGTGNFLGDAPAGTLLLGTLGTAGAFYPAGLMAGITTTPVNALAIAPIPEPAAALLGALALGFGFIRRRR